MLLCTHLISSYVSLVLNVVMLNPQVSQQAALSQPKKQDFSQSLQVSLAVSAAIQRLRVN